MREAMLIIPDNDNAGHSLAALQESIAADMVAAFGGCTAQKASGYWRDHNGRTIAEPVTELIAACPDNNETAATLRHMATEIDRRGNQQCAYCRFPDGHVELIPANNNAPRLAA